MSHRDEYALSSNAPFLLFPLAYVLWRIARALAAVDDNLADFDPTEGA